MLRELFTEYAEICTWISWSLINHSPLFEHCHWLITISDFWLSVSHSLRTSFFKKFLVLSNWELGLLGNLKLWSPCYFFLQNIIFHSCLFMFLNVQKINQCINKSHCRALSRVVCTRSYVFGQLDGFIHGISYE